jgi:hypothetical protein
MVFLLPVADATPRAVLPMPASVPLPRWGFVGQRTWLHSYCFLGTPLVHPEADLDAVWTQVLDGLRWVRGGPWLELPVMVQDGPVAVSLHRVCARRPALHRPVGERGFVRRRPEPTYAAEWISAKNRGNLARKRRNLERQCGAPVLTTERAATDPEGALDQFLHLEAAGWKGRTGTALLSRPGDTRFFREMAAGFAADDRLLVFTLEAGHRVLAQSIVLVAGSGLFGFKRAYDEAVARSSPGTLLDLDLLEWFHRAEEFTSLDTSSEPSAADRDVYGDRLALSASVVGLGRSARHVPGLFRNVDVARAHLRGPRATARRTIDTLRTAVHRGTRSGGGP